jgi:hypothetical protein
MSLTLDVARELLSAELDPSRLLFDLENGVVELPPTSSDLLFSLTFSVYLSIFFRRSNHVLFKELLSYFEKGRGGCLREDTPAAGGGSGERGSSIAKGAE